MQKPHKEEPQNVTLAPPKLYAFSGAGLSAESGVSTFRSAGGIWSKNNLDKVCNIHTWKDNRTAVFDFYTARRAECAGVHPNAAHQLLAAWQNRWGPDRVVLLTQNVDDLLEQAGCTDVVHLHGRLDQLHCTACATKFGATNETFNLQTRCPKCGSLKGVKPAVVFFGEHAPEYAQLHKLGMSIRNTDAFVAVGTAFEVIEPESLLPLSRLGHRLNWQVNPAPARSEWFAENLAEPASVGLAKLQAKMVALMD